MFKYRKYFKPRRFLNKQVREIREAISELKAVEIRPSELVKYMNLAYIDEKTRRALKRDYTELFFEEFDYIAENQTNLFLQITGQPGTGKSTIAISLATYLQKLTKEIKNLDCQIYPCYDSNDLIEKFRIVKPGDILLRDENPTEIGEYSLTEKRAIINAAGLVRDREISFILVSPIDFEFKISNIKLKTLGFIKEEKKNRALWVDEKNNPLGIVFIDLIENGELKKEMSLRKKELQEKILSAGGRHYINPDVKKIEDDVEKVYKYMKDNELSGRSGSLLKVYLDYAGILGDANHKSKVLALLKEKLKKEEKNENSYSSAKDILDWDRSYFEKIVNEDNFSNLNKKYNEIDSKDKEIIKDERFFEEIIEELKKTDIEEEKIEIFKAVIDKESYRTISNRFNRSNSYIFLTMKRIEQKIGYAGERAFYKRLIKEKGEKNVIYGPSVSPSAPDFTIESEKLIISFKTYIFNTEGKGLGRIGKNEQMAAMEKKYNLNLLIYTCATKTFEKFRIL